MPPLAEGQKREARERLRHDLAKTAAPNRRRFLMNAAAALAGGAAMRQSLAAYAEKAPSSLKITDIRTTILRIDGRDWTTLIEVLTNQGIVGLGQTTFRVQPKVINAAIENVLKPMLVGRSPFEYETLWMSMFINNTKYGMAGTHVLAVSALDIALWDLMGKALDLPVYRLLGGKFRERVEVYASQTEIRGPDTGPRQLAEQMVRDAKEAGFNSVKTHTHPGQNADRSFDARMNIDPTVEVISELRKAAGPKFGLLADVTNAYTPAQAIKVGRQLQDLDTFFMEEPVAVFDYLGLAKVADALDMRIAAGEQQFTRWEFYRLITEGHVDLIQPNVIICGGITEMRKIAAMAAIFDISIVSHNTLHGIPTAAAIHFWVSTHNVRYQQEYVYNVRRKVDGNTILKVPVVQKNGFVEAPEGPGLGVELDRAAVARLSA